MKSSLLAFSLLGCPLGSPAQESPSPPTEGTAGATASSSIQTRDGRIVIETEVNGKKESRVIDLNDPASTASVQGKAVIATEINGKTETRIVDVKDIDKLLLPFPFNEKPLARTGPVTWLGVATMEVPRNVSAQLPLSPDTGLLIGAVASDSPAAKAGLQESDVLSAFDDQILITQRQLAVLIANQKEGDTVKLTYFRKGQKMETNAVLGKHDAPAPMEGVDPLARVTRDIWKLDGTPPEVNLPGPGEERTDIEGRRNEAEVRKWARKPSPNDLPAKHDVSREIRRALEKLPAEVRSEVEKALRESGVLPHGTLPQNSSTDLQPPATNPEEK